MKGRVLGLIFAMLLSIPVMASATEIDYTFTELGDCG